MGAVHTRRSKSSVLLAGEGHILLASSMRRSGDICADSVGSMLAQATEIVCRLQDENRQQDGSVQRMIRRAPATVRRREQRSASHAHAWTNIASMTHRHGLTSLQCLLHNLDKSCRGDCDAAAQRIGPAFLATRAASSETAYRVEHRRTLRRDQPVASTNLSSVGDAFGIASACLRALCVMPTFSTTTLRAKRQNFCFKRSK